MQLTVILALLSIISSVSAIDLSFGYACYPAQTSKGKKFAPLIAIHPESEREVISEERKCGQDNFAVEHSRDSAILAVMDGAGKSQISSALSHFLASHLSIAYKKHRDDLTKILDDYKVRELGRFGAMVNSPDGGSTIVGGFVDKKSGLLQILTQGDSTLLVIRNGEIVAESIDNMSLVPEGEDEEEYKEMLKSVYNEPSLVKPVARQHDKVANVDLNVQSFQLQESDIIIAGSDGLFDNVTRDELLDFFANNLKEGDQISEEFMRALTNKIRQLTFDADKGPTRPFWVNGEAAQPEKYQAAGKTEGKIDDTTFIVAKVI